jgi:putative hydrolase of the HAD superfamily
MEGGRIQAVIFDAAGTLLRLREPVGETYARFAKAHGVDVPAGRLDEAFARVFAAAEPNVHPGQPLYRAEALERVWWHERVRETFRAADQMVRFGDFDAYFDEIWSHYASKDAWELAAGTREALHAITAGGRRVAVLSNFDQRLRGLLRSFDLDEIFEVVTTPADSGAAKPERQIFDVCLKRLGLGGHRAAYVGDRAEEDLDGARNAGMHPINVTRLSSLTELPAVLDALEKELA